MRNVGDKLSFNVKSILNFFHQVVDAFIKVCKFVGCAFDFMKMKLHGRIGFTQFLVNNKVKRAQEQLGKAQINKNGNKHNNGHAPKRKFYNGAFQLFNSRNAFANIQLIPLVVVKKRLPDNAVFLLVAIIYVPDFIAENR